MEIKLVHVTKSFGAKQVIQPTSFVIQSGSLTTLLGPSGCGKSTFLKSLNRMNDLVEGCRIFGSLQLDEDHPVADDRRTGNAGQR